MASPQVENGHTKIANELVEALARINLSAYEWRVLLCVIRKTYGWRKKMDSISLTQLVEMSGLRKPHACRAKKSLLEKNILEEDKGRLGLQKNYETWGGITNLGNGSVTDSGNGITNSGNDFVTNLGNNVTDPDNKTLHNQEPTKDNSKDTKQKKKTYCQNSHEFRLSKLLFELILERKPDFREGQPGRREKTIQRWAKDIDLLVRIDKRTLEQIETVIRWCQADPFWQSNILSAVKLRQQFDRLEMQIERDNGYGRKGVSKSERRNAGKTREGQPGKESTDDSSGRSFDRQDSKIGTTIEV